MSRSRRVARVVLAFLPALCVMAVIFMWSAQHGPTFVSDPTGDVVFKKAAHFVGYAILGATLMLAIAVATDRSADGSGARAAALERRVRVGAWAVATAYAASDELHQVFVSGRTPSVVDVAIDSIGAAAGVALLAWVLRRRRVRRAPAAR